MDDLIFLAISAYLIIAGVLGLVFPERAAAVYGWFLDRSLEMRLFGVTSKSLDTKMWSRVLAVGLLGMGTLFTLISLLLVFLARAK